VCRFQNPKNDLFFPRHYLRLLMKLSVIICTHTPRPDYLRRVLDALRTQSLPANQWELLLIDNASTEALAAKWDLSWHPNGRIIREDQLGLTPARLRGIREAAAEVLVFSDDDTVLDAEYLAEALRICDEWPMLGAWGGQPTPEFETPPPAWAGPYLQMLGLCRTEQDCWSNNYDTHSLPIGAGLCILKSVAIQYATVLQSSAQRSGLDRTGSSLLSGGDTDMALTACDMGMGTARFMALKFAHLIPKARLTLEYLLALREGMVFSHVILDSFRPQISPPKPLVRAVAGYFWRMLRCDRYERSFQLAAWRGEWKARRMLGDLK
ncbi:MAG: glycosyltransferase, partial [Verrucomicrobiota bacterium]